MDKQTHSRLHKSSRILGNQYSIWTAGHRIDVCVSGLICWGIVRNRSTVSYPDGAMLLSAALLTSLHISSREVKVEMRVINQFVAQT